MTLPVSFNEPTSLLQRVTEDMVCLFAISLSKAHMTAMTCAARSHCESRIVGALSCHTFLRRLIIVLETDMLTI